MAAGGKKRKRSPKEAKGFDPQESLSAGVGILEKAGVPFALAGRLAVWTYVSSKRQQFTKDVDFAVPYGYSEQAAAAAEEMGYTVTKLPLGYGMATRLDMIARSIGHKGPGMEIDA